MNAAVDHASEMDAEKGKLRIRHRIDKVAHQVSTFGVQFVVFASERHYAGRGFAPASLATRSLCRPAQLTMHAFHRTPFGSLDHGLAAASVKRANFCVQPNSPPSFMNQLGEPRQTATKSTIPVDGTWIAATTLHVGFKLTYSEAFKFLHSQPVRDSPLEELLQERNLGLLVATITFPHTSWGIPCSRQNLPFRDCLRGTALPSSFLACSRFPNG